MRRIAGLVGHSFATVWCTILSSQVLVHWLERNQGVKRARQRPEDTQLQPMFGEWLSLVEHLVRDQGVGGSNPLSPTILSLTFK